MMEANNVVSILARQERWTTAYELGDLCVSVSNHGRIHIKVKDETVALQLVDSVDMLGRVSEKLEKLSGL